MRRGDFLKSLGALIVGAPAALKAATLIKEDEDCGCGKGKDCTCDLDLKTNRPKCGPAVDVEDIRSKIHGSLTDCMCDADAPEGYSCINGKCVPAVDMSYDDICLEVNLDTEGDYITYGSGTQHFSFPETEISSTEYVASTWTPMGRVEDDGGIFFTDKTSGGMTTVETKYGKMTTHPWPLLDQA